MAHALDQTDEVEMLLLYLHTARREYHFFFTHNTRRYMPLFSLLTEGPHCKRRLPKKCPTSKN